MRARSWKFRLGLVVSTTLIGAGAMVPAATAAQASTSLTPQTVSATGERHGPAPGNGESRPGASRFGSKVALSGVKVGNGSVRVGEKVCAGSCNGTVNGTNGGRGGVCVGLCNGSANGGVGATGGIGGNGSTGGKGGVCAGVCGGSANGGTGGNGGAAPAGGDGGNGGKGGLGGICIGSGCQTSGQGGRGGNGGEG
ncbi:hypothetical protein SAVIM338S_00399 [Streptomyces avidinii]